jgi:hypothetical protein
LQQRGIRRGEVVAAQLQAAPTSRIVIEQAKGVLAERLKVNTEEAFTMLGAAARTATDCCLTLPVMSLRRRRRRAATALGAANPGDRATRPRKLADRVDHDRF